MSTPGRPGEAVDPASRWERPEAPPSAAVHPGGREHQLRFSEVSSMTKFVANEESSVPVNLIVTVVPAYDDRSYVWTAYPVLWLRLLNDAFEVPFVVSVSLSYAVVPVVSAVSTWR